MFRSFAAIAAAIALASCSGSTSGPGQSPARLSGELPDGLIGYASDAGIGVLDPDTGKSSIVAPYKPGTFRLAGPVWAPAPNLDHPVLYFTVHDDRPAETRTAAGVVPYDWLFRADPFAGTIDPIGASVDAQSEGPIGLVANSRYLALTVGCCTSYEVDVLDLTQPAGALRVLAKPPTQPAFFTEGAVPGGSGLLAVRAFGTGAWYWLNADAGVLNPFPLKLGPDDGPVAISSDGTMAAVPLPDPGAVIEPINSSLPIASPSASAATGATPSATPTARPSATPSGAKRVNSQLQHPDGLAWSPDARQLAIAINGGIELYDVSAADGPPTRKFLAGSNAIGVAWSGPIHGRNLSSVKASAGPQAIVDALLDATMLPAAADTPANRPLTKIYAWQFDSSKTSPVASINDATADVLARYPPLSAGVVFHHWAVTGTWALHGGCERYRVVITGSVAPTATTIGLATGALCSDKPSPSASPSPSRP